jgi:hypothetical protein
VIIWLQDFNNNGVLNMSPAEREEVAKGLLPPPVSINAGGDGRSADESDNDNGAGQARDVRNRYLQRIGVGEGGNSSDCEPLLH